MQRCRLEPIKDRFVTPLTVQCILKKNITNQNKTLKISKYEKEEELSDLLVVQFKTMQQGRTYVSMSIAH